MYCSAATKHPSGPRINMRGIGRSDFRIGDKNDRYAVAGPQEVTGIRSLYWRRTG